MRRLAPLLAFASACLVACSPGASAGGDPPDELASHVETWRDAALADYRFDFQKQCFCVREQVQPVSIEVRGGNITRVIATESGEDISGDPNLSWHTVPDLFDLISEAESNGTEPLEVRYDPGLGYPTHIEIGSLAADAGVIYTASNLEPL